MLIFRFRQGLVIGASAGAAVGLAWLWLSLGPAPGGPALLGAVAGLGAGAVWLRWHRAEVLPID